LGGAPLLRLDLQRLVLHVALVKTTQLRVAIEHYAEGAGRAGTPENEERGGRGPEAGVFESLAAEAQVAEHALGCTEHGQSRGERLTVGLSDL